MEEARFQDFGITSSGNRCCVCRNEQESFGRGKSITWPSIEIPEDSPSCKQGDSEVVRPEIIGLKINGENVDQTTRESSSKFTMRGCIGNVFGCRNYRTFVLAYQTLGMVYGGLSTSPLYLYSVMPSKNFNEEDYVGILSIIFWTLTMIGGIKYVLLVLHADNRGEGGTFAVYSLLCQHSEIGSHISSTKYSGMLPNFSTSRIYKSTVQQFIATLINGSRHFSTFLFTVSVLATCMLIGDGVLTPAISVLSAVEGLKVAAPSISAGVITFVSAAILVALFLLQRLGTQHISVIFSPVIVAWLTTTPLIGAYNIAKYYTTVYKAVSPHYMFLFLRHHGKDGWLALGGIVICITGAEAMFADLGHFNRPSMQMGFLLGVFPSNMVTYAGLTAYLIKNPGQQSQAFYKFTPTSVFWPMFIISTLAAIVASQGLISACFSLIKQCVAFDYFPRVRFIHTSRHHEGRVYSPEVNYSLMVFCTAVVLGFRSSAAIGHAYGVAVIVVMLITTFLVTLVMLVVWETSAPLALAFFGFFTLLEGCYLTAVLSKVSHGGWLPFLVSGLLSIVVFSWVHGRRRKREHEMANRSTFQELTEMLQNLDVKRVPGVCFFYSALENDAPPFLKHYLKTVGSLHRVVVLTNVQYGRVSKVSNDERILFKGAGYIEGLYHCTVRYGYAEPIGEWNGLTGILIQNLENFIQRTASGVVKGGCKSGCEVEIGCFEEELAEVKRAKRSGGAVFVVGKAKLKAQASQNWFERFIINKVYGAIHRNCSSAMSLPGIHDPRNLVEIGMIYEV